MSTRPILPKRRLPLNVQHSKDTVDATEPSEDKQNVDLYQEIIRRDHSNTPCPVCAKTNCRLRSHRRYALQVLHASSQSSQRTFEETHSQKSVNSPPRELCTAKVDPFGEFPLLMTPELDEIYRHFYMPWTSSTLPGPQRHLFPTSRYRLVLSDAQHDKTLFIALCSMVATQLAKIRNRTIDETTLRLQILAISMQKQACTNDGPSDARILTTLCIMSNHVAGGELDKLGPHMRAADSFLKQRGGLQNLKMGGILADNIMYGDYTHSVSYNIPSRYKMPLPALEPPYIPRSELGTAFSQLPISQGVLSAARDTSILLQIYNLGCRDEATSAQRSYFSYLANVIEFSLAELNSSLHTDLSLDYCVVLACLLVNTTILRNYGSVNPVVYVLEDRFWNCLNALMEQKDILSPQLKLWLIYTGSLISAREPSRFEGRTIEILSEMMLDWGELLDFSYATAIFDIFIWSEPVHRLSFHMIWSRANALVMASTSA